MLEHPLQTEIYFPPPPTRQRKKQNDIMKKFINKCRIYFQLKRLTTRPPIKAARITSTISNTPTSHPLHIPRAQTVRWRKRSRVSEETLKK